MVDYVYKDNRYALKVLLKQITDLYHWILTSMAFHSNGPVLLIVVPARSFVKLLGLYSCGDSKHGALLCFSISFKFYFNVVYF
jgi:hypothetical protein